MSNLEPEPKRRGAIPENRFSEALREAAGRFRAMRDGSGDLDGLGEALKKAFDAACGAETPPRSRSLPHPGDFARLAGLERPTEGKYPLESVAVLYADPNDLSRRVSRLFLERLGAHLELASNQEEAAKAIERSRFDAIIACDEDGGPARLAAMVEACARALEARKDGKDTALLALADGPDAAARARSAGAAEALRRPFDPEALVDAISRATGAASGDPFDANALLERFGGRSDSLAQALGSFASDAERQLALLKDPHAEGADIKAIAHSLKGTAGTLGARAAAAAATALDDAYKAGDAPGIERFRVGLSIELAKLAAHAGACARELAEKPGREGSPEGSASAETETSPASQAAALSGLLARGDVEAETLFESGSRSWATFGTPTEIARLAKCIRTFDYPEAAKIASSLAGSAKPSTHSGKDRGKTVLVIDDSVVVLRSVVETLRGDYRVLVARSADEGISRLSGGKVDLILLDVIMPGKDGFDACERIKASREHALVPVLFMTGLASPEEEARGFALGAADFIRKPFEPEALRGRLKLQLDLSSHREYMEELVDRRTRELVETQKEVVFRLARAAEYRDSDTGLHIKRLALYCQETARRAGLTKKACELIYYASMMHDVGKIGIPDRILLKPGKLDPEEWEIMRTHTTIGERLLDGHESEILIAAKRIAGSHHEKWDGSGYPRGLSGRDIPLEGRITAICDVYDALMEPRPYKRAWTHGEAIAEIRAGNGTHFDPEVVEAFEAALPEIETIRRRLDESEIPATSQ